MRHLSLWPLLWLVLSCGGSGSPAHGGGADAALPPGPPDAAPEPPGPLAVSRLRSEYREEPLGLDTTKPRLEWLLESAIRDERQTAYQVLAASTRERLDAGVGDLWDSGKVVSERSTQIEWAGAELASRSRVFWKVRAWDKDDVPSAWSAPASFELGLLAASDWQARWISLPGPAFAPSPSWIWYPEGDPVTSAPSGMRYFRRSFDLPAGASIDHALALLTVDDAFDLYVNGAHVGAASDWRVVQSVDVGAHLVAGANTVAIAARNGESAAGVLVQLQIALGGGATTVISGDASWKAWNAAVPATWMMPGFDDSSWTAARVTAPLGAGPWGTPSIGAGAGGGGPARYLRKGFTVDTKVVRARLHATALGLYEASIDGVRVGTQRFTPGWTDYAQRLQVQTYDVTAALGEGAHVLGLVVGDGWYQGKVGFLARGQYGPGPIRALAQLELELADGSTRTIVTDGSWQGATGPIVADDLLDGESYDARLEVAGWDMPGASDASHWAPVQVEAAPAARLVPQPDDGIRVQGELAAVTVTELHPGVFVYDLGQNMVGWVRLRVAGEAGAAVELRFAEVLNPDGSLYTTNLRGAAATDRYVLRGGASESYEPRFTTHGFRYVELTGDVARLSAAPGLATVTGVVAHAATPVTGTLTTSEPYLNQLQSNIVWSQKDNFTAVPTDCPQRDERLGWMGDAQIFARTATLNMDVAAFFTKWTRDIGDAQYPDGAFSEVSPRPSGFGPSNTPAWGDAGVIIPWTVYLAYGDTRILAEHFEQMAKWVDLIDSRNANHLWQASRGSDYGDWLNIGAETDHELLATAFYAHSCDLVARAARVLGRDADATKYEARFAAIRTAFQVAYVEAAGRLRSDTQTAYALALRFGLLSETQRGPAGARLVAKIAENGGYLNTGFLGVGHLLPALSSAGATAAAYQLLANRGFPSWRYEIDRGATTIWERWNGIKTDGTFEDPGMNSFNHYSFGSVDEWMYGTLAGIVFDEAHPGWTRFGIAPEPGGGLTHAHATFLSPQGTIVSDWTIANGIFTLKVSIPVGTRAAVRLPRATGVTLDGAPAGAPGADGAYELGSGDYVLTCSAP